jgi:hypothetical protein
METRFLKKVLQATEELDTLIYLHSSSFELALERWLKDLTSALTSTLDIYQSHIHFNVSASVISLNEKKLEKQNIDFLISLQKYIDGIDLNFTRKALQYVKIANEFKRPATISEKEKIIIKGLKYTEAFKESLAKIRKFSAKLLNECNSRKIKDLGKYQILYTRLEFLTTLDFDIAIKLLKEKGEI